MDIVTIVVIICTGIIVGVINTFAGAGASITIALFSFLGLSLPVANATNRISVIFQTITMSGEFYRQGSLNWRLGLILSIPTCLGAVMGSLAISMVCSTIFAWLLIAVLLMTLVVMVFDPTRALKGRAKPSAPRWYHYIILVFIGFYGGAFHIGVGYLFLSVFIMGLGYDFMTSNALKGFVVLTYTLFSLAVFASQGEVNWLFGLVHSVGNVIGAYFATRYARFIPVKLLRYALIVFISLTVTYIIIYKV